MKPVRFLEAAHPIFWREREILEAYEAGKLESIATKAELARLREAARATAVKDRRVNIRMSAGDLRDIRVKAMQGGSTQDAPRPGCVDASEVRRNACSVRPHRRGERE